MKIKKIIFIVIIIMSILLGCLITIIYEHIENIKNHEFIDNTNIAPKNEKITILKSTFKYGDDISFNLNLTEEEDLVIIVPSYIPLSDITFMKNESIYTWKNINSGKYNIRIDDKFSNGEYEIRVLSNNEVVGAKKIKIDSDIGHESPMELIALTNYIANDASKLIGLSIKFKHSNNISNRYLKMKVRIDNLNWVNYDFTIPFSLDENNYGIINIFDFSKSTLSEFKEENSNIYNIFSKSISNTYNNYFIDLNSHKIEIALSYNGIKYSVPIYLSNNLININE